MAKVKIDQLADEVVAGLMEYKGLVNTDMKSAVRKAGQSVKKDIQANAPKRTGEYSKSWRIKTTKETAESLELTVYSAEKYSIAHLLEKGHAKRGGGRVAARPHIAPAEEKAIKQLEEDIKEAIGG